MSHYQRLNLYVAWVKNTAGQGFQLFVNIEGDTDDIEQEIEDIWNEVFAKDHGQINPNTIEFLWTAGAYILPYNP